MKLTLSPTVGLPDSLETTLHVMGDVITIDGTPYDLSPVPEGGEATAEDTPFIGKIARVGGIIHCTVMVSLDGTAADAQSPDPWVIESASGNVVIPAERKPVVVEEVEAPLDIENTEEMYQ